MRIHTPILAAVLFTNCLFTLACYTEVEGDRAVTGQCPADDCDPRTPNGLVFSGLAFYDEGVSRLGPILAGGSFNLDFRADQGQLGKVDVQFQPAEVLGGGLNSTSQTGGQIGLEGLSAGTATVQVVNERGDLYDQLDLEVFEIEDVELVNVSDVERDTLIGGCEEMVGIRLIASDGGTKLRAFDRDVSVSVSEGPLTPESWAWDCFRYEVPAHLNAVVFTIEAGGETFVKKMGVVPGLHPCPVLESSD